MSSTAGTNVIVFYLTFVPAVEEIYLSIVNIVFYLTFVPAVEDIYLSIVNIVFYLTFVPSWNKC
jgi:hypothetical protein